MVLILTSILYITVYTTLIIIIILYISVNSGSNEGVSVSKVLDLLLIMTIHVQGAHDTIESLQTQVLDLEIKLTQAQASLADSQHAAHQGKAKLQEQLRQSELKAAVNSDSESSLRALSAEVTQLRSELVAKVEEAAGAAAAAQEAASAVQVLHQQEKLQQAEAYSAASAEANAQLAQLRQELAVMQTHVSHLESSAADAEQQHKAALQVSQFVSFACIAFHLLPYGLCSWLWLCQQAKLCLLLTL